MNEKRPAAPSVNPCEERGIRDILRAYISGEPITKEQFLCSVGYLADGQIQDTLFDTFIFQPSPNFLYDLGPEDNGMAALTQTDWLRYITDMQFAEGVNMNALEAAMEEVKAALGKSDYKAKVFMSLFMPVKRVSSFGEVEGRNLNFSRLEDRKAAVKWMIDEQLRRFEAQKYANMEVVGFYWFHENLHYNDEESFEVIRYTTDYVRSLGYVTIWSPFFHAPGYNEWKKCRFDLCTMQPNFFVSGSPNGGGEERLHALAEDMRQYGMGAEIELEGLEPKNYTVTKKYYIAGAEEGYMYGLQTYYLVAGPHHVFDLCHDEDPYARSLYDDTYAYVKKTFDPQQVWLK